MKSRVLRVVVGIEAMILGALLLLLTPKTVVADEPCCNTQCVSAQWEDECVYSLGKYCTETNLPFTTCITYICNPGCPAS